MQRKCFCGEKADTDAVHCDGCGKWIHYSCAGRTAGVIEAMDDKGPYYYTICLMKTVSSLTKELENLKKENALLKKQVTGNEVSEGQACQVTRIGHVTHAFERFLTLTLIQKHFSCISC